LGENLLMLEPNAVESEQFRIFILSVRALTRDQLQDLIHISNGSIVTVGNSLLQSNGNSLDHKN